MEKSPSIEWFGDLKERANKNQKFREAARWFNGTIGWRIDKNFFGLRISEGRVQETAPDSRAPLFTISSDGAAWDELLTKGTINRLFRQKRIQIEGDKVEAMRYWKILWYLTEIGRKM